MPNFYCIFCYLFRYLAQKVLLEFRSCAVKITHVQGHEVDGVGIKDGNQITILAMMRGGEPMARGVYDVFPDANFIHYDPNTATPLTDLLRRDHTIIVVDSVINSGRSIRDILLRLNGVCRRVLVLSGVTQKRASENLPIEFPLVRFYTLRISENSYTGIGPTDTGDRLFGTC